MKKNKKKILIFGSSSLLGGNLIYYLKENYSVYYHYTKRSFYINKVKYVKFFEDVENIDKETLENQLSNLEVDIIINCIALTDIDFCEKNKKKSKKINLDFPILLGKITKSKNIKLIHISTDQLYADRIKFKNENINIKPLNIYGLHKYQAEKGLLKENNKSLILRTNFFGVSPFKKKISENIIEKVCKKENVYYTDQYFTTPIYVKDFSLVLMKAIKKDISGIFNLVGNDRISKFQFAKYIINAFKLDNNYLIKNNNVNKFFYAKRNIELSLGNNKIKKKLNIKIRALKDQILDFAKDFDSRNKIFKSVIPYGKHSINKDDIISVKKTLLSNNLTQGHEIKRLEDLVAEYVGSKYAVSVSSCTAGLHLACMALGVNKKSNYLTSPNSFVSTANAAKYCGSNVIFSDISLSSLNLDPLELEKKLKTNNIDFIGFVDFSGQAAGLSEIRKITKKKGIKIIEDAAHGFGGKYHCGSKIGSNKYSDVTVFSFHPVKILAGGEGGIITTNDRDIYEKILSLRTHGIVGNLKKQNFQRKKLAYTNGKKNPWYYDMQNLGMHYRQTDIHASLIISQFQRLSKFLNKRKEIAKRYDKIFKENKIIKPYQNKFRNLSSNHLYVVDIDFQNINISRAEFINRLGDYKIKTQVHYIPVYAHSYYYYKNYKQKKIQLNNMEKYYKNCLSLPLYYDLKFDQQRYVVEKINKIINS